MLNPFFRARVLAHLSGLARGRLEIRDDAGTVVLGAADDADSLRASITVRRPRFWRRAALGGSLGAAEAYLDGDWDAKDLTDALRLLARSGRRPGRGANLLSRLAGWRRRNTKSGSRRNIRDHYDLGNAFFAIFLDETLTYSAAIFPHAGATLREAQEEKLDRVCRKLDLGPDDRLLEIGTGWGSFALHAAGRYGARVTTTTISREQFELASGRVRAAGLGDRIEVLERDYRDLEGRYDKVASIEMIEAVGHEFHETWFAKVGELLVPGGRAVVQSITMPDGEYDRYRRSVDFIRRSVFPGGCLLSVARLSDAARAGDLRVAAVEEIGPHYATTLRRWRERFLARTDEVLSLGYPPRFLRLWEYYLSYCEAGFAERRIGNVQVVFERRSA